MRVGVIGLGLIGGSMAKAYRRDPEMRVYGMDVNRSIVDFACIAEAIYAPLTDGPSAESNTLNASLQKCRDAVADNDYETLRSLLAEGSRIKGEVDGR